MNTLEKLQNHLSNVTREYARGYYYKNLASSVVCSDGTTVSVQASETHYCTPRSDEGPYTHVEVWMSSAPVTEFDYDEEEPSAYVPIEDVVRFIDNHGGMVN